MMGLEPTTFCMAMAGVRTRSVAFAQTACLQRLRVVRANGSEPERTRTNERTFAKQDQPEFEQALRGSVVFRLATHGAATPRSAASAGTDTSAGPQQMTPKN
jgi:hypothetical protein